ncbi:MAG: hypothetical protein H7Z13_11835 [Ferruginibacter sp.]|nr:hypothetical protein [Ferruginibacter sp.]
MNKILISAAMVASLAFTAADKLTGRWETKPSSKGNVTGIVFKPDNSFEGYINKKPFFSGTYTLKDSIFSFFDNGCVGVQGSYKIIYFSNADSVRFEYISDSCDRRRDGISRMVLGRVNKSTE